MDMDFNDLTDMAQTLKDVQQQTAHSAEAGFETAQAQVVATKELADAIRLLAGSIWKVAERCPLTMQDQE